MKAGNKAAYRGAGATAIGGLVAVALASMHIIVTKGASLVGFTGVVALPAALPQSAKDEKFPTWVTVGLKPLVPTTISISQTIALLHSAHPLFSAPRRGAMSHRPRVAAATRATAK